MSARARISQSEMDRATKSVAAAGLAHARIIYDLARERIEIIIGAPAPESRGEEWSDDDV